MPAQRPLTPRQHVILRSVARGKTNKDIAAELGISEQGVKVHISRLLERYGAENRVELVNITRAWPEADNAGYNGHPSASAPRAKTDGHASKGETDIAAEVRALRDVLGEINVALKFAREMPATADVGPLIDAIRTRVGAALDRSAKLDALLEGERTADSDARRSAS